MNAALPLRTQALRLYRHVFKSVRQLPKDAQSYYKDTSRDTFVQFRAEDEPERIISLIERGYTSSAWVLKKYNVKMSK